jgi:hypothetical protein
VLECAAPAQLAQLAGERLRAEVARPHRRRHDDTQQLERRRGLWHSLVPSALFAAADWAATDWSTACAWRFSRVPARLEAAEVGVGGQRRRPAAQRHHHARGALLARAAAALAASRTRGFTALLKKYSCALGFLYMKKVTSY